MGQTTVVYPAKTAENCKDICQAKCCEASNNRIQHLESLLREAREALEKISNLDPEKDTTEGYNEWGQADCFMKAQDIADKALFNMKEG